MRGAIWLEQAISGALRAAEIGWVGYKMGTNCVVGSGNASARNGTFMLLRAAGAASRPVKPPVRVAGGGRCSHAPAHLVDDLEDAIDTRPLHELR